MKKLIIILVLLVLVLVFFKNDFEKLLHKNQNKVEQDKTEEVVKESEEKNKKENQKIEQETEKVKNETENRVLNYETKNFKITIKLCEEGVVDCNSIVYEGYNKNTKDKIKLIGKTFHTKDVNGNSGRFLGYVFANKQYQYIVEDDKLVLKKGDETVLEEKFLNFYTKKQLVENKHEIVKIYSESNSKNEEKVAEKINDFLDKEFFSWLKEDSERISNVKIKYILDDKKYIFSAYYEYYGAYLSLNEMSYVFDLQTGNEVKLESILHEGGKKYVSVQMGKLVVTAINNSKKEAQLGEMKVSGDEKDYIFKTLDDCKNIDYIKNYNSFNIKNNILYLKLNKCLPKAISSLEPFLESEKIPFDKKYLNEFGVGLFYESKY